MPVRVREFKRNIKKELKKLVDLLQAYCLVRPDVRFSVVNQAGKGSRSTLVSTPGKKSVRDAIGILFGQKQLKTLVPFAALVEEDEDEEKRPGARAAAAPVVRPTIVGFVSKADPAAGRSTSDRHFLSINKRPCDHTKLTRGINEVFRQFVKNKAPVVVLDIEMPRNTVDVNVTPDKRAVFMQKESDFVDYVKKSLSQLWEPSRNHFKPAEMMTQESMNQFVSRKKTPPTRPPDLAAADDGPAADAGDVGAAGNSVRGTVATDARVNAVATSAGRKDEDVEEGSGGGGVAAGSPVSVATAATTVAAVAGETPEILDDDISNNAMDVDRTVDDPEDRPAAQLDLGDTSRFSSRHRGSTQKKAVAPVATVPPIRIRRSSGSTSAAAAAAVAVAAAASASASASSSKAATSELQVGKLAWACQVRGCVRFGVDMNNKSSLTSHYKSKHPRKKFPGQSRQRVRSRKPAPSSSPTALDDEDAMTPEPKSIKYDDDNDATAEKQSRKRKSDVANAESDDDEPKTFKEGNGARRSRSLSPSGSARASGSAGGSERATSQTSNGTGSRGSSGGGSAGAASGWGAGCGCCEGGEHTNDEQGGDALAQAREAQLEAADGFKSLSDAELSELAGKSAKPRAITRSFDLAKVLAGGNVGAGAGAAGAGPQFTAKMGASTDAEAEAELARVINKDDFEKMEILGQFNLGFIVVRFNEDLFIIDQHATDEKYNFERLQRTTKMKSQRLFVPKRLELTAISEEVVLDNIEIFRRNGFDFDITLSEPPSKRVRLSQIPLSKGTVFNASDVDELIFMLSEKPGVMCRPSRLRSMFAMRSCRSSVMIGTALDKSRMRTLVDHMGTMEQPWNCPHGRPTMRHVFDLRNMPVDP